LLRVASPGPLVALHVTPAAIGIFVAISGWQGVDEHVPAGWADRLLYPFRRRLAGASAGPAENGLEVVPTRPAPNGAI
jgi:hypothetical protein